MTYPRTNQRCQGVVKVSSLPISSASSPAQDEPFRHARISAPFDFKQALREPGKTFDLLPVLDLCVIALIFSLVFTRFVAMPGVAVALPSSNMEVSQSSQAVVVMTINYEQSLFFDGGVYDIQTISSGFDRYFRRNPNLESVLLVKAEGSLNIQSFLEICALAQSSGFTQIQVIGERAPAPPQGQLDITPSGQRPLFVP